MTKKKAQKEEQEKKAEEKVKEAEKKEEKAEAATFYHRSQPSQIPPQSSLKADLQKRPQSQINTPKAQEGPESNPPSEFMRKTTTDYFGNEIPAGIFAEKAKKSWGPHSSNSEQSASYQDL